MSFVVKTEKGLSVPVWSAATSNWDGREDLVHTVLEKMFTVEDLGDMRLVKLPDDETIENWIFSDDLKEHFNPAWEKDKDLLAEEVNRWKVHFLKPLEDGASLIAAGGRFIFSDKDPFGEFFKQETADWRRSVYASLFTSDCYKGVEEFENVKVVVVDFEDPEYVNYKTSDCHGIMSNAIAERMTGDALTPFQFRMIHREGWSSGEGGLDSVLAKGTFIANEELLHSLGLTDENVIILDKSSIKNFEKDNSGSIPVECGEYFCKKVILGNRANASEIEYDTSWQFLQWFSEDAIAKDFGEQTLAAALALKEVAQSPIKLIDYIIYEADKKEERDRQKAIKKIEEENVDSDAVERFTEEYDRLREEREIHLVKILKADKHRQLSDHPWVAEALKQYVADKWKDLATKSAIKFSSGMALPTDLLKDGEICIPHLPSGEVIITRYPIVSKNNIRVFNNLRPPESLSGLSGEELEKAKALQYMMKFPGTAWINPQAAAAHFQEDFDGDQTVAIHSSRLPNCTKETKEFDKTRFADVIKEKKTPYAGTREEIAIKTAINKTGLVANAIGKVQSCLSTINQSGSPLLDSLFLDLQRNVDTPKSMMTEAKWKRCNENLKSAMGWVSENGGALFFDYHKKKETYLKHNFPESSDRVIKKKGESKELHFELTGPLSVLPKLVNPQWEACQIKSASRESFRHLFSSIKLNNFCDKAKQNYQKDGDGYDHMQMALHLNGKFKEQLKSLRESILKDEEFGKAIGECMNSLAEECRELSPENRTGVMAALGYITHSSDEVAAREIEAAIEVSSDGKVEFKYSPSTQWVGEPEPVAAYVLSVPFAKAEEFKDKFNSHKIDYQAVAAGKIPFIDFVIKKHEVTEVSFTCSNSHTDGWQKYIEQLGINFKAESGSESTVFKLTDRASVAAAKKNEHVSGYLKERLHPLLEEFKQEYRSHEKQPDFQKLFESYREENKWDANTSPHLKCVPPSDWTWVTERERERGKASLVFHLFPEEVSKHLQDFHALNAKVIGINHHDNEVTRIRYTPDSGEIECKVVAFSGDPNNPENKKYEGRPILQIKGHYVGMFSQDSPSLPVGTEFKALLNSEVSPAKIVFSLPNNKESGDAWKDYFKTNLTYNKQFTHRANNETGMRDFNFKVDTLSEEWKNFILEQGGTEIKEEVKSISIEIIPETLKLPYPPPGQAYKPPEKSRKKKAMSACTSMSARGTNNGAFDGTPQEPSEQLIVKPERKLPERLQRLMTERQARSELQIKEVPQEPNEQLIVKPERKLPERLQRLMTERQARATLPVKNTSDTSKLKKQIDWEF